MKSKRNWFGRFNLTLVFVMLVRMEQTDLLQLLRAKSALLEGHFLLSSGLHSPMYLQCARILQFPPLADSLGRLLAGKVLQAGISPQVVMGPALGGMIIGHEVARALGLRFLFVERINGGLSLRRGFQLKSEESVLIVEDVMTTGLSIRETTHLITTSGGCVCGIACLIDRRSRNTTWPAPPVISLLNLEITVWPADGCPLCASNSPLLKPGSRS